MSKSGLTTQQVQSTFERQIRNHNLNTSSYSPEDFVNPDSYDSQDKHQLAYVVLSAGYVFAIVFAEYPAYCEQDALDEAADSGKLDGLMCDENDLKDYETGTRTDIGSEHCPEGYPEYEGIINLGNAGEPFASESLDIWILNAHKAFGEDPALMTITRVQAYLEAQLAEAERACDATDVSVVNPKAGQPYYEGCQCSESDTMTNPAWMDLKRRIDALQDAQTLVRFAEVR